MAPADLRDHYRQDGLIQRICDRLADAGRSVDRITTADLAGVDEFHLGGRPATVELLADLDLRGDERFLDVGCGIGGTARTIAGTTGCHVVGVDLTLAFAAAAAALTDLVGSGHAAAFHVADATALPFPDESFDAVTMIHVGMNIEDKCALVAELRRVLCPGGVLAVYDIMRVGDGAITFPVPWSSHTATSHVATPDEYRQAFADAGLEASAPTDRGSLVRRVVAAAAEQPPPVDLSSLMGPTWPTMFANLRAALDAGIVSPVQMLGRRVG